AGGRTACRGCGSIRVIPQVPPVAWAGGAGDTIATHGPGDPGSPEAKTEIIPGPVVRQDLPPEPDNDTMVDFQMPGGPEEAPPVEEPPPPVRRPVWPWLVAGAVAGLGAGVGAACLVLARW